MQSPCRDLRSGPRVSLPNSGRFFEDGLSCQKERLSWTPRWRDLWAFSWIAAPKGLDVSGPGARCALKEFCVHRTLSGRKTFRTEDARDEERVRKRQERSPQRQATRHCGLDVGRNDQHRYEVEDRRQDEPNRK